MLLVIHLVLILLILLILLLLLHTNNAYIPQTLLEVAVWSVEDIQWTDKTVAASLHSLESFDLLPLV
jgi:hypothetical protein